MSTQNGFSTNGTKRAAIYARVSTKNQFENGYGLKYQIADCKTYANSQGIEIVEIIKDDITGESRLEERNGGKELLKIIEKGKVNNVIVWRLDRLSRPPKNEASRLLTTIEHFARLGVTVHDCDGGENDPMQLAGGLLAFIKSYQASEERETIRKRTLKGKKERAKAGQWVGMWPGYGYDKVGERKESRLVINEAEARIIILIFEHFVGWNNRKKMSIQAIAAMLNRRGVPTPGSKRNMKTRGKWTITNIRERILKNPRYIGKIKNVGYILDLPELAIVEPALFEQAQKQIKLNKRRHQSRKPARVYLMSARFTCHCGKAVVGGSASRTNSKGEKVYYPYYRCSGRYNTVPTNCQQTNLKAEQIDGLVWEWVYNLLQDENALDEGLDELETRAREQVEPTKRQLETVQNLIEKLEGRIGRLVSAFGDAEDETIANAMKEQISIAVSQKDGLLREQTELELKIANIEITPETRKQIKDLAQKVRHKLPTASAKDKQRLFDALGLKGELVHLENGDLAIEVSCILDSDSFCIENQTSSLTNLHTKNRFLFSAILPV